MLVCKCALKPAYLCDKLVEKLLVDKTHASPGPRGHMLPADGSHKARV